jgi:tetratricopeptide (TPR) repeat protein
MIQIHIGINLRRSTPSISPGNLQPTLKKMNDAAVKHLSTADPILGEMIARVGPCGLKPDHARSPFQALVQAVAHQQLNGKAANTILSRFIALFPHSKFPTAQEVFDVDVARIAGVGFSRAKAGYLKEIARMALEGVVPGNQLWRKRRPAASATVQNPHCLDPQLEYFLFMFKWLLKAVKPSGYPQQAGRVSELGVPPGGDDAIKWFRKAAEKGTSWGQFNLGIRYFRGDGVPQDYAEAIKWFQKAADQKDAMSQYWLGEMYEKGLGMPVDLVKAYHWYCLAASQGIREAENAYHGLQANLTPEQIADGQAHPIPSGPKKSA